MARAVGQHKTKPAKRTSRPKASRASGRGSRKNPSKTEPSPWLSFKDAFPRLCDRAGSSEDAKDDFEAILRSGVPSAAWQVNSNGKKTYYPLSAYFWKNEAWLSVKTDANAVDYLVVHYTDYVRGSSFLPGGPVEFCVRAADFARELERLYPTITAPPQAPSKEPRAVKGPVRGEIDRFGGVDRALFPDIERLMKLQRLTPTEAVRQIPEDKLAGRGTLDSRIRRVSDRFRREKL